MLAATQASFAPIASAPGTYWPVSIPSYNGTRKQPNLVPLLALLLAREGMPVLVHGVSVDPGRMTSAEIFAELAMPLAASHADAERDLATRRVAFMPLEALVPKLARLLALRRVLGVRNSMHTLVKLPQPFAHGTEGEAVADTRRQMQVDWLHDGLCETLIVSERSSLDAPPVELPESKDAAGRDDPAGGTHRGLSPSRHSKRECRQVAAYQPLPAKQAYLGPILPSSFSTSDPRQNLSESRQPAA